MRIPRCRHSNKDPTISGLCWAASTFSNSNFQVSKGLCPAWEQSGLIELWGPSLKPQNSLPKTES